MMIRRLFYLVMAMLVMSTLPPCAHGGLSPEKVSLSDPQVQPLLQAMAQVDRSGLGFTPVTTNAQIRLEGPSHSYDAMLHVDGITSRTIAFRKTATGYRWIGEQETYQGPKWWQTPDGAIRESLSIDYQIEPVNGIPTNQIFILYSGDDTNLLGHKLTLAEIKPILDKWATTPLEPQPPDLYDDGFGSPPFALVMLIIMLVACCLVAVIGLICAVIIAVMVTAGIISASVIIGLLRKSVSAGFRALFIQLGAIGGMAGGAVVTCIVTVITKTSWDVPSHWIVGLLLGLLCGILFAWVINKIWSRVVEVLTQWLKNRK